MQFKKVFSINVLKKLTERGIFRTYLMSRRSELETEKRGEKGGWNGVRG